MPSFPAAAGSQGKPGRARPTALPVPPALARLPRPPSPVPSAAISHLHHHPAIQLAAPVMLPPSAPPPWRGAQHLPAPSAARSGPAHCRRRGVLIHPSSGGRAEEKGEGWGALDIVPDHPHGQGKGGCVRVHHLMQLCARPPRACWVGPARAARMFLSSPALRCRGCKRLISPAC